VPLAPFLQGDEMATESGLQETAPPGQTAQAGIGHNGGPALDKEAGGKAPKDAADKAATEDMAKRAAPEARLKAAWQDWLAMEAPVISWLLVRSLPKFTIMAKAAGDDPAQAAEDMAAAMPSSDTVHPGKPVTPPGAAAAVSDALGDAIATAVNSADWATIQAATAAVLREAAVANVTTGIDQVQPMVAGIVEKSATPMIDATKLANPRAIAYAEDQAARLVSGVEASTRNMIRATIVAAQRDGLTTAQVQTAIENSAAFSAERAEVIAKYELKKSSVQGNLIGWRAMQARLGIKINKRAILGPNEAHCAVCLACVAEGAIPVDDEFVAGDGAPFHPRCECTIVPVVDTKQKPASIAVVDAGDPMAKAVGHHTHGRFEGPGYEDFTGGEGL